MKREIERDMPVWFVQYIQKLSAHVFFNPRDLFFSLPFRKKVNAIELIDNNCVVKTIIQ